MIKNANFDFNIAQDTAYDGYFNSLLHHRKLRQNHKDDKDNEIEFIDSYYNTEKPKKWMTQEEKDAVRLNFSNFTHFRFTLK